MNTHNSDIKMTDELERRLIQREIDQDTKPGNGSVFALEIVVGTLLLVGMLLLATRFG